MSCDNLNHIIVPNRLILGTMTILTNPTRTNDTYIIYSEWGCMWTYYWMPHCMIINTLNATRTFFMLENIILCNTHKMFSVRY